MRHINKVIVKELVGYKYSKDENESSNINVKGSLQNQKSMLIVLYKF